MHICFFFIQIQLKSILSKILVYPFITLLESTNVISNRSFLSLNELVNWRKPTCNPHLFYSLQYHLFIKTNIFLHVVLIFYRIPHEVMTSSSPYMLYFSSWSLNTSKILAEGGIPIIKNYSLILCASIKYAGFTVPEPVIWFEYVKYEFNMKHLDNDIHNLYSVITNFDFWQPWQPCWNSS